jgi:peptide/nickel transport system substrate-binding protein
MRNFSKKTVKCLLVVLLVGALGAFLTACRTNKHADALRIGSTEVPKTFMPYVSAASVNTFVAGKIYDTLLGSTSEPADYYGEGYTFPDGSPYTPVDLEENYFKFTDGLIETSGAYARKSGSKYGFITFTPTSEQYAEQLIRKKIVKGRDEIGNPISETDEQFQKRSEEAVPTDNWREYLFKVRAGYTWNDGAAFSASDIEFTFKYALKYSGALASIAFFLNNYYFCEAVGNDEFRLILASNALSDIKTICNSILILPRHKWENIRKPAEEKNLNPVGTGAYKVLQFIEDASVTLEYRTDYDKKLEKEMFAYSPIKKISVIKLSDTDVLLNSVQMGEIDAVLDPIDETKANAVKKNSYYNKVKINSYESPFVTTLAFNVGKKGVFRDENFNGHGYEIRRAIAYAIDQERLIRNVKASNAAKVGGGLVQEWAPHALRDENGNYVYHETNVEKAKALLDAAGYPANSEGKRNLSFKILAGAGNEALVREIGAIASEALGINIEFKLADAQYSEKIKQSNGADFDMIINSVSFNTEQLLMFDARFGIYPNGSPRVWNCTGIISSELSALMRAMDVETDVNEQYKKAQEVQKLLTELCVEVPLYNAKNYSAYSDINFTGWMGLSRNSILDGDIALKFLKQR